MQSPLDGSQQVQLALQAADTANASSGTSMSALASKLSTLADGYAKSHEFWDKNLTNGTLRGAMLEQAYGPAQEYLRVVREEFLPALQAGRAVRSVNSK